MPTTNSKERSTIERELPTKVAPIEGQARSSRFVTLADLEKLCKTIRKDGGKPNTPVRIMRDAQNGDLRLVARITSR